MVIHAAREMIIAGRLWPESFYRHPSLLIDLQALVSVPAYFNALKSYSAFVDFGDIPIHYFALNGRLVTVAFGVAGCQVATSLARFSGLRYLERA